MGMQALYDLRDKFCEELEEISRKSEMSAGDLEAVHKLTDTIKNIDKICIMDETGEYSQAGDWEARGRFGDSYGGYDDGGDSYARRGTHYVRGHYSRDGGMRGGNMGMSSRESYRGRDSRGRYSRRGYSRADASEMMIKELENLMDDATTERQRDAIKDCIEELKR